MSSNQSTAPSVLDWHADWRAQKSTPQELVQTCLARMLSQRAQFNALITPLDESALAAARASGERYAQRKSLSAMDGIPVVVKDFFDTAGVPTTAGFAHFAGRIPARDAALVSRLKEIGAVILGKSNMDRFGSATTGLASDFGAVVNPLNPALIPGGSSSGSAACIAAGHALLSIDTDAAGSARLPAACCGISAFKPSYGVLSTEGILAGEPVDEAVLTFSHAALQARRVRDLASAYQELRGTARDPEANVSPGTPRKVGIAIDAAVHPVFATAWQATKAHLRGLGWEMMELEIGLDRPKFFPQGVPQARHTIGQTAFAQCDLIVLPTLTGPVPTVDAAGQAGPMALDNRHVFWANYFGLPALSMPLGSDDTGHPFSFQLLGPPGADVEVLASGIVIERSRATSFSC